MKRNYSIIATSYNDENEIKNFLDNILSQSTAPSEIVIADGGSNDNTIKIITEEAKKNSTIKLVTNGRLNISQGYNLALKNAKYNLIGVVGIGNIYEKNYFTKLLCKYEATNADMVYSPILGVNNSSYAFNYNNTFLNGDYGQRLSIPSNHGALVKKEIFQNNNFFYEYFVYAGEDTEFYTRAVENGASTIMVEDAIVRWKSPTTISEHLRLIKNYGIASIQILPNLSLFKIILKRLGLILIFIFLLMLLSISMKILLLISFSVISCKKLNKIRKSKKSLKLLALEYYMYPLVYLRYCKYMKKDYKVKRGK